MFAALISGIIGAVAGALVTYWLQARLVKTQIEAAEKTQREFLALLRNAREYFGSRSAQYSTHLQHIDVALTKIADHLGKVAPSGE